MKAAAWSIASGNIPSSQTVRLALPTVCSSCWDSDAWIRSSMASASDISVTSSPSAGIFLTSRFRVVINTWLRHSLVGKRPFATVTSSKLSRITRHLSWRFNHFNTWSAMTSSWLSSLTWIQFVSRENLARSEIIEVRSAAWSQITCL